MTINPAVQTEVASAPSDKELNFRKQEEMFNRKLEQERLARQQLEDQLQQLKRVSDQKTSSNDDDDDFPSDEPYVDHRRLQKAQSKMEKKIVSETDQRIQAAVQAALADERKNQWLRANPDFPEIMNHAQTLADTDPELAETILSMPEGFERQKLVYKTIKAAGLHKPKEVKPSMQDQINQNRRNMFYAPSGMSNPPFENKGDFSNEGQKNAYQKMKEAQKRVGVFN